MEFHSTRLFPKHRGANAYIATGIAGKCDWVFLSDSNAPKTHLSRLVPTDEPRHIFLSLRNPSVALSTFATEILPTVQAPFVLLSGSEDATIPNQIDKRWHAFSHKEMAIIQKILEHPNLIHWYAENLDEKISDKLSALPLGMVYPGSSIESVMELQNRKPVSKRPLTVLCGHRVRRGPQWTIRRDVNSVAKSAWSDFTTVLEDEVTETDFLQMMDTHSFVLCVEGGGLDPSPKAWQCLHRGAIPIVRRTPTTDAYADLPVVFVDSWSAGSITAKKLAYWRAGFCDWFDNPDSRKELLYRLSLDYWWNMVTKHVNR